MADAESNHTNCKRNDCEVPFVILSPTVKWLPKVTWPGTFVQLIRRFLDSGALDNTWCCIDEVDVEVEPDTDEDEEDAPEERDEDGPDDMFEWLLAVLDAKVEVFEEALFNEENNASSPLISPTSPIEEDHFTSKNPTLRREMNCVAAGHIRKKEKAKLSPGFNAKKGSNVHRHKIYHHTLFKQH